MGCFAGDAAGYPVTIGAPGSYQLTSELVLPAGVSGILVQTDDVHIDLNDFAIRGPATCAPGACIGGALLGVGKNGTGPGGNRCSVRNGAVVGIDGTGIRLAHASRVEGVLVSNVTNRGIQLLGTNGHVTGSTVDTVGAYGIEVPAASIVRDNTVTQVNLRDIGAQSIWPVPGQGNACDDGRCTRFRRYYLTRNGTFDGAQALTACDAGFHFASFAETRDLSQLSYDLTRGLTAQDAGAGPPSVLGGWLRTGQSAVAVDIPGRANCNVWTSNAGSDHGSIAFVNFLWGGVGQTTDSFLFVTYTCDMPQRVWCIED